MRFARLAVALCLAGAASAQPTPPTVASPDGRIAIIVGADEQGQPTYAVRVGGREVIAPSVLGFEFERYRKLSGGTAVTGVERRAGEDRYTLTVGKVSRVAERYNEIVVHLAETGAERRRFDLVFRAYDGGVALRYRIPAQPSLTRLRLFNELTQFAFPADYQCHGLNLGSFGTSHEGEYDPVRASAIRPHNLYELPLVCRTGEGGPAIAFAEADVTDWPVMYLTGTETGRVGVQARLSPRIDDPAIAVAADASRGLQSPWRIVMVGNNPGRLIENTLVTSLNPPARGDFSWVRPGKSAWDWWSGPLLASVPRPGSNDATLRGFIDFAAARKLPYMTMDEGWYVGGGGGATLNPGADPTRPVAEVDVPGLVAYGRARGVGLIAWVHWKLLDRDLERVLAQYERWGFGGIKVDFMNRDDQEMVGFYHRLAAATARRKLLLNLHGATHPWGLTRTWPNFITQEGVLGAEYNKWTRRITARHNVTLPFTRMLAGPMDYTPGGYRNRTPGDFAIAATGPQTQTTRAHGLAMYVAFDSPLATLADTPDAYRGEPGMDFLEAVPTSWDETRFVAGDIGDHVAIARRKGRTWYLGAMTNETGRALSVPLTFLGRGRFAARLWQDGGTPMALARSDRRVRAAGKLALTLAASGGAVAIIEPLQ